MYRTAAGWDEGWDEDWEFWALAGIASNAVSPKNVTARLDLDKLLTLWQTPSMDDCLKRLQ